jgi:polysaccharide pyruvyl transferase WcaK-like protein
LKVYEYEIYNSRDNIALLQQVLKKLELDQSFLVERPIDDRVLVETINGYQSIITCRMHSSIAAFTLDVPSVILSWNDKVEKLMEIIGYPERAIKQPQFTAQYIVDSMEKAAKQGIDDTLLNAMKSKARESVTDYVDLIINSRH